MSSTSAGNAGQGSALHRRNGRSPGAPSLEGRLPYERAPGSGRRRPAAGGGATSAPSVDGPCPPTGVGTIVMTGRRALVAVTLIAAVGFQLRSVVLGVPPVLPALRNDLHLSFTQAGALTSLPVLCLGLAAVPGAFLINRYGARSVVGLSTFGLGVTALLRLAPPEPAALYVFSALMALCVAVAQPAMSVVVRLWFPHRIQQASTVFSTALGAGGLCGSALTAELETLSGWRGTFVIWSTVALLVGLVWLLAAPNLGPGADRPRGRPERSDRLARGRPLRLPEPGLLRLRLLDPLRAATRRAGRALADHAPAEPRHPSCGHDPDGGALALGPIPGLLRRGWPPDRARHHRLRPRPRRPGLALGDGTRDGHGDVVPWRHRPAGPVRTARAGGRLRRRGADRRVRHLLRRPSHGWAPPRPHPRDHQPLLAHDGGGGSPDRARADLAAPGGWRHG